MRHFSRRQFLQTTSAVGAAALLPKVFGSAPKTAQAVVKNAAPLVSSRFVMLPLGAIEPMGWLRRQLEVQAQGLTGYLGDTWPDVGPQSGWLGGKGESWERGPYYLDGLLPLAYLLQDGRLQAKAQQFVDWTLKSRRADGMFGPESGKEFWWPRMVMLKCLTQYYEVSGDPKVVPLMEAYFAYQRKNLPVVPLTSWARARWQDNLLTVLWLYNRNGDKTLLDLAQVLKQQGYDWTGHYRDFKYTYKVTKDKFEVMRKQQPDEHHPVHGVDVAMGLKATALWSQMPDGGDGSEVVKQWEVLDRYHGMPNGIYSADELLAGTSPTQGTELCTVVEAMFSLEQSIAVTGNAALADRLEKIAFNALPGTISEDMWSHQYDQQPNQIECGLHAKPWTINGPESNLFGLEPNFGCCTANYHQGWPKLTSSLWMATADDGLAAVVYAPCSVSTVLKGKPVQVHVDTEYPFRGLVDIRVQPAATMAFPLLLRVPEGETPVVRVNGKPFAATTERGFLRIERKWTADDKVEMVFSMKPRIVAGASDSISVMRGPLVFSLPIKERWVKLRDRGLTADWQVFGESPWNYALADSPQFNVTEYSIPASPFKKSTLPVTLETQGYKVTNWLSSNGVADDIPAELKTEGEPQRLTLVPYASSKLRITAFPRANALRS